MKKGVLFLIVILFSVIEIFAQSPNQFKYQAVLRNADGNIIADETVDVDISILQGSTSGISVFDESHNVTTTEQGIININIGSVNNMGDIAWDEDSYFIKITVNGIEMGVSQLLSVPYALFAKTAENVLNSSGGSDFYATDITSNSFGMWYISSSFNLKGRMYGDIQNNPQPLIGIFTLTVKIFSTPSGGTALWSETLDTEFENGFFNVYLGNISNMPQEIFSSENLWYEISLAAETFNTRIRMDKTGYTMFANEAASVSWDNVEFRPSNVSYFTNDAGYLTSEIDGSVTNEIQDLNLDSNNLTITNNASPTSIDLNSYLDDQIVTITAGNGITVTGTYPDFTIMQTSKHYVGELIGTNGEDGIVCFVDYTGDHGLICSKTDIYNQNPIKWNNGSNTITGALSQYNGEDNTSIIIANQGAGTYAASLCSNYSTANTSAGDWHLPSIDELREINIAKYIINKTLNSNNFVLSYYWSAVREF